MVPTFVYVIEGLLGITVVAAFMILAIPSWRRTILISEPANLAAMMALTSNDTHLVQTMGNKDSTTSDQLETLYQHTTFAIQDSHRGPMLRCVDPPATVEATQPLLPSRSVLPVELSWYFGASFLSLQCLVIAALVFTYISANLNNGLSLPSKSLFVNQILVRYLPMVIGAFFEPVFTWLTRTLCMLQPFDELRKGGTHPSRAITVDYDSLPPQAVIFRTLKAENLSLASVCCIMTLLANLLSVAFSNVLRERATLIYTPRDFTSEYTLPLSGSGISNSTYDQFYIAVSNFTAGTPLPAWTDSSFFYVPFGGFDLENKTTALYQARTPAVSASLKCYPMYQTQHGNDSTWDTGVGSPDCKFTYIDETKRSNVPEAVEYTDFLSNGDYAPGCDLTVFAGWGRSQTPHGPVNKSWIGCKPELNIELRDVTVNSQGLVQSSTPAGDAPDSHEQLFEPDARSIIDAVHLLLGTTNTPKRPYTNAVTWHNDSYPSDFFNYLMVQTLNNSAILDPLKPPPSFETTAPVFGELYTRMFAITLGTQISDVLQRTAKKAVDAGFVLAQERRIFVSEPMFLIAVVILGTYMLVTVSLYVCRPWKVLPRMPTTIASQIAFFAASHGLNDFATTSSMSEKERNMHIKGLRRRYGFGRFVGTDGKPHVGIEREPLVQVLTKQDLRAMGKVVVD
ncbi:hypothetical protein E4T50_00275 [Aureobasidium sp. EXF-12298]|nr:hypothetical protein E4T50_00275 [Aureobasidium sp. EXF-12298]